ncbi:MFS transporter [Paenibacillus solisilvae]|uniref:MFS transporter n=1 Tax=Paenibacillus solisilvae TaxID=2486751 RepID=A0ABW0W7Q5_9BACL
MTSNPKRWAILQIINMGTLMSTLDVGIVNVSLPMMSKQFSVPLAQIQWVSTIYLLGMAALLPFLGKLSDRLERRQIYSWGFFIFSLSSLLIVFSHNLFGLLLSRCLQGLGAAMIMANSQALVRQLFPDHERGRALGVNAIVISAGTLTGPALGGMLLEFTSWPWLFLINVPLGLIAFILGLRWFPRSKGSGMKGSLDIPGSLLLAAAVSVLMLAAEASKDSNGFTSAAKVEAAIGLFLIFALWLYQRRITYGIIDRELFSQRKILLGNASSFFINLSQVATIIPITFYLQGQLGYSTSITGALLILQPLLMGVVAPFAGWFRDRYGGFFPITLGSLFCSVSMLSIACFSSVTVISISFHLVLFGIGMGLFHATNNAEIMSSAPESKISLAGSLLALVRYLGMIAGIGLATLLVGDMGYDSSENNVNLSLRVLFGICFLFCMGGAVIGWLRPRDKPQSQEEVFRTVSRN